MTMSRAQLRPFNETRTKYNNRRVVPQPLHILDSLFTDRREERIVRRVLGEYYYMKTLDVQYRNSTWPHPNMKSCQTRTDNVFVRKMILLWSFWGTDCLILVYKCSLDLVGETVLKRSSYRHRYRKSRRVHRYRHPRSAPYFGFRRRGVEAKLCIFQWSCYML